MNEPKTREEIQKEFTQLLRTHEQRASQIATKAEEAEQIKNRELVERAAGYTVESIINSLAKLQLGFGSSVEAISSELQAESSKLGELRRAIEVERQRLDRLRSTVVAAEALAILKQDGQQRLAALTEQAEAARKQLEDEMAALREQWQREREDAEAAAKELEHNQAKERQQAEEEHEYERARLAKVQTDEDAVRRTGLERKLADEEAAKAKDWAGREKVLGERGKETEELRAKVGGFPAALEDAANKARDKAIATVNREAKFELEMLDKEHDANVKVFELKVQTLEQRIERQTAQIADLSAKLDATIAKSQNLAEQAFQRPTTRGA
ncbi:coiled-coil domain-containing protein [Paraliomyxa miuraensis]|uniref:hypothetical protein n=1 Tax=Paraliomyxa miuraensis TaxID=376150 RepID=UPI00225C4073|nr:hypothetical protein [Paraliomyxa miuraensis]MCX4243698.1 hypothetical protein [Paraliomyxa miuraensis]